MIKKISVADLKVGMYIQDLNCGWMDHPFLRSSLVLADDGQLLKIREAGIRDVYIDTALGIDGPGEEATAVEQALDREMESFAEAERPAPRATSLREEAEVARRIQGEANRLIKDLMQDVRLGKQIQSERVEPVVERITQSIMRNGGALLSLCRIKDKDNYTFQHSVSVCGLQTAFCRALSMSEREIHEAGIGGLLHDIGKTTVANEILNKPGRLTDDEFAQIKCHVVESRRILEATPGISTTAIQVAAQHHERHDGSGYPLGLKGGEISQMGQMAAIVDVYDAITSERCYHKGLEPTEAMRKMFEWSQYHFNPQLVQSFTRCIGIYPTGSLVLLDSGRLAVVIGQCEGNLLQPLVRVIYSARHHHYVAAEDIDLSRPRASGGDRIIKFEKPETWGIDVARFL